MSWVLQGHLVTTHHSYVFLTSREVTAHHLYVFLTSQEGYWLGGLPNQTQNWEYSSRRTRSRLDTNFLKKLLELQVVSPRTHASSQVK